MITCWNTDCAHVKTCTSDRCDGEKTGCYVKAEERYTIPQIRAYMDAGIFGQDVLERDKSLRNRIAELEDEEDGIKAFVERKEN